MQRNKASNVRQNQPSIVKPHPLFSTATPMVKVDMADESADCLSPPQKQIFTSLNHYIELETQQLANRDEYMIRQAKEYIAANYHESITLNDVAAHVFLQPNYFSTVFKAKTGITFRQYLRSYRMKKPRL